ncbi:MAG: NlpC/P60 family protein, partial [Leifsonia flava]
NLVETAIGFASAQLGKPYASPGDSWNTWDCSGLTKAAYAAAGSYIGTHSATNQYWTMAGQGRLVPYSQRQRGDLIFWGSGGDYYHVAIYLGGDRILEAADWGKPVREWYIWGGYDVAGMVGRPG